jgi:hypothetical protein
MAKNALTHFKDIAYKSLQLYISRMTCQIGNIALNQEVPIFPEGSPTRSNAYRAGIGKFSNQKLTR